MSRRVAFKQADVSRALKGAKAAGLDVGRFEIDRDGRIVVMAKSAVEPVTSEFDDWVKRNESKTQGHQ